MATSDDHSAFTGIDFPLSEDAPVAMACIPEFTADNIIDFMLFLKRFQDSVYEVKIQDKSLDETQFSCYWQHTLKIPRNK